MSVLELIGAKDQVKDAKCENPEAATVEKTPVDMKAVADTIISGSVAAQPNTTSTMIKPAAEAPDKNVLP